MLKAQVQHLRHELTISNERLIEHGLPPASPSRDVSTVSSRADPEVASVPQSAPPSGAHSLVADRHAGGGAHPSCGAPVIEGRAAPPPLPLSVAQQSGGSGGGGPSAAPSLLSAVGSGGFSSHASWRPPPVSTQAEREHERGTHSRSSSAGAPAYSAGFHSAYPSPVIGRTPPPSYLAAAVAPPSDASAYAYTPAATPAACAPNAAAAADSARCVTVSLASLLGSSAAPTAANGPAGGLASSHGNGPSSAWPSLSLGGVTSGATGGSERHQRAATTTPAARAPTGGSGGGDHAPAGAGGALGSASWLDRYEASAHAYRAPSAYAASGAGASGAAPPSAVAAPSAAAYTSAVRGRALWADASDSPAGADSEARSERERDLERQLRALTTFSATDVIASQHHSGKGSWYQRGTAWVAQPERHLALGSARTPTAASACACAAPGSAASARASAHSATPRDVSDAVTEVSISLAASISPALGGLLPPTHGRGAGYGSTGNGTQAPSEPHAARGAAPALAPAASPFVTSVSLASALQSPPSAGRPTFTPGSQTGLPLDLASASAGLGAARGGAASNALQDYKAKARALRAREFELERSLRALSKYSATATLASQI